MSNKLRLTILPIIFSAPFFISAADFKYKLDKERGHLYQALTNIETSFIGSQDPNLITIRNSLKTDFSIRPNNLTERIQSARNFNELRRVNETIQITAKILYIFKTAPTKIKDLLPDDQSIMYELTQRFHTMRYVAFWLNATELAEEDFKLTLHDMEIILAQHKINIYSGY